MRLMIILIGSFLLYSCSNRTERSERTETGDEVVFSQNENRNSKEAEITTEYMSFFDSIGQQPEAVSKVIPKGFLPLDTAVGDINLDGIDDIILVAKNVKEHTIHDFDDTIQYDRPLLLLLGASDGTYAVVRRNDNVVLCINCSGAVSSDPYNDLKIKNGFFSVEHGVSEGPQHWSQVTTFMYDKLQKEWFLFKEGHEVYDPVQEEVGASERKHTEVKTKKDFGIIPFEKYKIAD
jgi:hypothetical protein